MTNNELERAIERAARRADDNLRWKRYWAAIQLSWAYRAVHGTKVPTPDPFQMGCAGDGLPFTPPHTDLDIRLWLN